MQLVQVDFLDDQRFIKIRRVNHELAIGVNDGRTAPKTLAVFVANAVAVDDVIGEHAAISLIDEFNPTRTGEAITRVESPAGAGALEKQNVRAILPEQISRRHMPEVFADQHADTTKAGIKSVGVFALVKVAAFVKHGVG